MDGMLQFTVADMSISAVGLPNGKWRVMSLMAGREEQVYEMTDVEFGASMALAIGYGEAGGVATGALYGHLADKEREEYPNYIP